MALEMKSACEKCGARLGTQDAAYICSFECTFCPACAHELKETCPNCGGELVRRPARKAAGGDVTESTTSATPCPVAA